MTQTQYCPRLKSISKKNHVSVGELDVHLGAKLKLMQLENGAWAWGLSWSKYVQETVQNCKKYVEEDLPKFY